MYSYAYQRTTFIALTPLNAPPLALALAIAPPTLIHLQVQHLHFEKSAGCACVYLYKQKSISAKVNSALDLSLSMFASHLLSLYSSPFPYFYVEQYLVPSPADFSPPPRDTWQEDSISLLIIRLSNFLRAY